MSKLIVGENDLTTENPQLAKQWHPSRNGNLTPRMVSANSHSEVWWIGECGHEWTASIKNRNQGRGCPYCSNQKVLKGFNDLESNCPKLAKEWDYVKNELEPDEVIYGSAKVYYWLCDKGHSFQASIAKRKRGDGCPYCGNKRILVGYNDLATTNPELAKEWDYEKNDKAPQEYIAGSNEKVYWKCERGHSWSALINSRNRGSGCPFCSGQKVCQGFNDLETINPELAKEWDYERNAIKPSEVTVSSSKSFWWKCRMGHSWFASITNRNQGRGCPECDKRNKTSFPEQAILYYVRKQYPDVQNRFKAIFDNGMELDIYIPSISVGIEYDGPYHKGRQAIERDLKKYLLCKDKQIKLVRISNHQSDANKDNCDVYIHSDYDYNNYDAIDKFMFDLAKVLPLSVSIDVNKDAVSIKKEYFDNLLENSFGNMYPEIAKEWDYELNKGLTPYMFKRGSVDKVWWHCSLNHKWKASIECRVRGHDCIYCSGQKALAGFNDLKTVFPDVLADWNYELNKDILPEQVTAKSGKKVWWICHKGHASYLMRVSDKVRGRGCKLCKNQKIGEMFSKPVFQYSKQGELLNSFTSVTEASSAMGVSASAIANACRGKSKSCAGYLWKY